MDTWFTIINSVAGRGKGKKIWPLLTEALSSEGIPTVSHFTEFKKHSVELCTEAIEKGFRKFIIIGGDGTYNEIANAVMTQEVVPSGEISLAFIPAGTGNDWRRSMEIPSRIDEIVRLLKENNTQLVDVGEVSFYNGDEQGRRYFINIAGLGYDSYVLEKFLSKYISVGPVAYLISVLRGIFSYKNIPMEVKVNGETIVDKVFLFGAAIGKFYGSGMKLAPNASLVDGLFDVTVMKNVSKFEVVGLLRFMYNGNYMPHKKIETHRTSEIEIASEQKVYLQMDGELAGHTPIHITSRQLALQVLVPKT